MFNVLIFGETAAEFRNMRTVITAPITCFQQLSNCQIDLRITFRPGWRTFRENGNASQNRWAFCVLVVHILAILTRLTLLLDAIEVALSTMLRTKCMCQTTLFTKGD